MLVRVCKDCGTVYSEKTERCESCGTRLSEPMENEDAIDRSDDIMEENANRRKMMSDRRYSGTVGGKDDYGIEVGPAKIISGIIAIIAILGAIGASVLFGVLDGRGMLDDITGIEFSELVLLLTILAGVAIFDSFWPNAAWAVSTIGESLSFKGNLEPTDLALFWRVIADYALALFSLAMSVLTIFIILQDAGIYNLFRW